MQPWIPHPTILATKSVELVPLESSLLEPLFAVANDPRIWTHYAYDGSNRSRFMGLYGEALHDRTGQYTFLVRDRGNGNLLGSTKFMDIQPRHRKLEIGTTWYAPDCWGTEINPTCKYLMLSFAFERLQAVRVTLKTDALNSRSRRAIEKLGAQFEGVLRNDMVRDNGTLRDSAYYSILDAEWPGVRQDLLSRVPGLTQT
jgi:RimJ/RimL family protein N-acetyltransferase